MVARCPLLPPIHTEALSSPRVSIPVVVDGAEWPGSIRAARWLLICSIIIIGMVDEQHVCLDASRHVHVPCL